MVDGNTFVDFSGASIDIHENGFLGACSDVDVYEKVNRIGEGTYGIVYRARHKQTKQIVALKRMRVNVNDQSLGLPLSSFREIVLLKKLRHHNIVNVIEIAAGHSIDSIFMVMDYCDYDLGTLLDNMKTPFVESEVKSLVQQLLCGIEYCHNNYVVHRDLKLPNMLLTRSGVLKIADFGLARLFHEPRRPMTPQVATLWYRAPELILGSSEYTKAIDLWSVGCIFGELLIHRPFMPGNNEQEQMELIVKMIGAPNDRIWPGYRQLPLSSTIRLPENRLNNLKIAVRNVSNNTILLLNSFLTYDPRKRISVQAALDHPYFYEIPTATRPIIG
ncbi:kinase-like domain-containing protein [Coemansia spiralis]|nr:kinase-like domain-containing protein [Coemansia spiralis]